MRIAVTGITGTFGRAFAARVLREAFLERLVGVSRDELKQSELAEQYGSATPLRLFLGDVRDEHRMAEAFHHCDVVVHAAALKRVDSASYNPTELVQTNVTGTHNVIRAACRAGVGRVLVVSSDKAVMPLNIYGASKMMAEQFAVSMNTHVHPKGTRVAALRYGNVLHSRGSVTHIWQRQVAAGEPLTLTHRDMSRFVLTIGAAVEFALSAIRDMEGGEIYVPVLPSVKLSVMADALAGRKYPRREVGLRAGGEKLAEALLSNEEPSHTVRRGPFYVVTPHVCSWRTAPWQGEAVPPDLEYVSNGSHGWLSVESMKAMMQESGC